MVEKISDYFFSHIAFHLLISDGLPIVLFDRYLPNIPTDYVGLDNYNGTYEAVAFLVEGSRKNIALVTLSSDQTQMAERQSGYLAAMEEHGLSPIILKVSFENDTETTVAQCVQFIKEHPGLDAIIFATNYLSLSGIKAISDRELKISADISLIDFDDHDVFKIYNPTISAISQPLDELTKQLFKTLLDKLENKVRLKDISKVIIQPELSRG
ncbi:substrate-binding domain-containing protein [Mucilaginibacter celer]|nr:substrate-binding domain-containing protein [Mucilaginibacter celer]